MAKSKLGALLPMIDTILEADRAAPVKLWIGVQSGTPPVPPASD